MTSRMEYGSPSRHDVRLPLAPRPNVMASQNEASSGRTPQRMPSIPFARPPQPIPPQPSGHASQPPVLTTSGGGFFGGWGGRLPRVYFAGKIGHTDWRHTLGADLWDGEFGEPVRCERFIYCGPFFVACDHGCSHGDCTHGLGHGCKTFPVPPRWLVPSLCLEWIRRCDLFFAWIDDPTCYGTLVEIGWAQMMRKPVYIGFKSSWHYSEFWFAAMGPRTIARIHTNAAEALERALAYGAATL